MTDRTCNGWKNHATWLVSLWTDGDSEITRISAPRNGSMYERSVAVREYVQDTYLATVESEAGLACDLLMSSLHDVDWKEIVEHHEDAEIDSEAEDEE